MDAGTGETRRCPRCGAPLNETRRGPVNIDVCASCHGVFLDRGEIERLLRASRRPPGLASLQALLAQAPGNGHAPDQSCPRCGAGMHPVSLGAASGESVSAERCTSCGGLWLDAGELGAIAVLSSAEAPAKARDVVLVLLLVGAVLAAIGLLVWSAVDKLGGG